MPPEQKSEVEKLFEVTKEENILDRPLVPDAPKPEVKVETKVEDDEIGDPKTRYQRRLKEKLQAEREANIAMAARLEAMAEAQRVRGETEPSEYLKKVERIYGTDSPEAKAATELLSEALQGVEERAVARATEFLRAEQQRAAEETSKEERRLSAFEESIEDTYNVEFTPEIRKGYFALMERLSPKDSAGNIIEYADPHTTWELFQEKLPKREPNPAKDLASRAMSQSGSVANDTSLQDEAGRRLLREAGII